MGVTKRSQSAYFLIQVTAAILLAVSAAAIPQTSENEQPKIGLALNAGANIAAAAGLATLRGFQQQSILINGEKKPAMEAFDYISGTSGGIIPTVLYAYAQNADTEDLLDAKFHVENPSKITRAVLNRRNSKALNQFLTGSLTISLIPTFIRKLISRDLSKAWTVTSWKDFLAPFGIKRNRRIASLSEESNNEAKKDTIRRREGIKAIPLINIAMAGETQDWAAKRLDNSYDLRTALAVFYGNTFVPPEKVMEGLSRVNSTVFLPIIASPFDVKNAYLTHSSDPSERTFRVNSVPMQEWGVQKKQSPATLEFLVGAGTNFPGQLGAGARGDREALKSSVMLRTAQKRAVALEQGGQEDEMMFVDGGIFDCLGVPALVQQKVRTIVSSICGPEKRRGYAALYEKTKGESFEKWLEEALDIGIAEIASYFGYMPTTVGVPAAFMNRMFEGGDQHLRKLRKTLDTLFEAGKPLVTTMKGLKTVDNPFWGIEGGEIVDLTIIYYSLPKDFVDQVPLKTLPPENKNEGKIDSDGYFTNKEFKDFPHIEGMENFETHTSFWRIIKTGILTKRQVNMYNYLGAWIIKEAWDGLTVDGEKLFGGFEELFKNALAN